jgi:putative acetyltransferase
VLVRRATAADTGDVRAIHAAAFARPGRRRPVEEVALLDGLLAAGDVLDALSLVAEVDGELVGHVVCSRAAVEAHAVAALGPIGVRPEHQRRGIGSALVHTALGAADALELPLVGLLGSTEYYPRFGFVPSTRVRIDPPEAEWGDHFQIRTLSAWHPGIAGRFRYAPAFGAG